MAAGRLALCVLALVAAVAASSDDYYLLRLQVCDGQLTIHGLWPQWAQECNGSAFDVNLLKPIRTQMESDWPSCVGNNGNEDFWAHEWSKHGTCTGLVELKYFETALNLYSEVVSNGQTDNCFDKSFNKIDCPNSSNGLKKIRM
ncbi:uncharacterized protein MONBRDRAFT_29788 [Monosiga brevicollis MX1]|uniref:Uncharacterized protein n=1 Tax=Monosiga brevicollis TaxID=81824 RepID=A9VC45_MONBE|nr:uncharacterized protein MONBRDRAFT_29788 [Monosiga brevicollis MX1]EDQ84959.1 predicted protein [Monosiga brevicollis MX1]|eukprot:XP_001750300.1 hypothetical protein [Monosiga brevicollis MX1]